MPMLTNFVSVVLGTISHLWQYHVKSTMSVLLDLAYSGFLAAPFDGDEGWEDVKLGRFFCYTGGIHCVWKPSQAQA